MYKSLVLFCVVLCVAVEADNDSFIMENLPDLPWPFARIFSTMVHLSPASPREQIKLQHEEKARPKWQFLPPKPGYVPVYIRPGDTPLEEINPDLAEAFHAYPAGRSAGKELEASPEVQEAPEPKPSPEDPEDSAVDRRPYEKKFIEKKTKKPTELTKPEERR